MKLTIDNSQIPELPRSTPVRLEMHAGSYISIWPTKAPDKVVHLESCSLTFQPELRGHTSLRLVGYQRVSNKKDDRRRKLVTVYFR